jgi:hypothetical protein
MQCERLIKLAKQWYLHVKDETMAPARMVQFIKQHVASCPICAEDPDIDAEIDRITEIILPDSKIPKAVRMKQEAEEAERNNDSEDLDDDEESEDSDDSDDSDDSEDDGKDDTDEDALDSND